MLISAGWILFAAVFAPASDGGYIRPEEMDVTLLGVDWRILENLRDDGDQPYCPRPIDHFLDRDPSAVADGDAVVRAIEAQEGWRSERLDDGVRAIVTSPATAPFIAVQTAWMQRIASRHGFSYDGWGTYAVSGCGG